MVEPGLSQPVAVQAWMISVRSHGEYLIPLPTSSQQAPYVGGLVLCHLAVANNGTLRRMRMVLNLELECSVSDLASFPSCAFSTVVTLDYPNWLVKLLGYTPAHIERIVCL